MDKKERNKLISYFIMGDGGVYLPSSKSKAGSVKVNAKYIMNMLAEHRDYMEEFQNLVDFTKVTIKDRPDYNKDGYKRGPQLRMESNRHPLFTEIRERVYVDSYKGLDPMYIKQIDWHCLAILYQADGALGESFRPEIGMKNPSYSVTLNMKRLSYGDYLLLGKYLTKNLGLYWTLNRQKQYYTLRFKMKSFENLMNGMAPYIHDSFKYKIRTFGPSIEGGDIVCTPQGCGEVGRNDQS
jgi:hypothetical protein